MTGTFSQLTLWGGASPILPRVLNYILTEAWPKQTHFLWQISANVSDRERLMHLMPAAMLLMQAGHTVELWQAPPAPSYENSNPEKHRHIAGLYRDAFQRASRFDFCLSIEDDNLPPPGALSRITQHISASTAQIGGVYRIRGAPEYINATDSLSNPWTPIPANRVPQELIYTPMMGAGYTLYLGSALRRMRPVECVVTPTLSGAPHVAGWDDWVGREFARMGYQSFSDGSLWIGHYTPEVASYLQANNLAI
jgi:hypothetical protein